MSAPLDHRMNVMAEPSFEAYSRIVDQIYSAAHDPRQWTETMDAVRILFNGSRACMLLVDPVSGYRAVPSVDGDLVLSDMDLLSVTLDDGLHQAWMNLAQGQPSRYGEIMDLRTFQGGRLSRDYFAPREMDNGLVCAFRTTPTSRWTFDISRSRRQEDFSDTHVALAKKLEPHFKRAMQIDFAAQRRATLGADEQGSGYFVVDARGKILDLDDNAKRLLDEDSPLVRETAGLLRAAAIEDTERLNDLVASATSAPRDSRKGMGGSMIAGGDTAAVHARLMISVSTVPPDALSVLNRQQRCALVLVRPLHGASSLVLAGLAADLFCLPPNHARLAAALASGVTLREAAQSLGITYSTARAYLEEIFRKTSTHRQPELVALLKSVEATWARRMSD